MSAVLTAPDSVTVGQVIVFSIAGATSAGELDISASAEGAVGGLGVTKVKAAASSGAYSSSGNCDLVAEEAGHVNLSVTDVTATLTVSKRIEVFRSV